MSWFNGRLALQFAAISISAAAHAAVLCWAWVTTLSTDREFARNSPRKSADIAAVDFIVLRPKGTMSRASRGSAASSTRNESAEFTTSAAMKSVRTAAANDPTPSQVLIRRQEVLQVAAAQHRRSSDSNQKLPTEQENPQMIETRPPQSRASELLHPDDSRERDRSQTESELSHRQIASAAIAAISLKADWGFKDGEMFAPSKIVKAIYPRELLRAGISGVVTVGFELAADGTIHDAWIANSSGEPSFDQAALDAIKGYRFTPRIANVPLEGVRLSRRIRFVPSQD